ncbi:GNAT family N-acetyltransferase [Paenibacillus sp. GP183]|uniref:GNAT family N-acetyltransferase n=1 Tax=Paenibacillus sp. GP183 TaxID=1882751 RepID=UPI0008946B23|nr:GNAT family N-acetyltransferase [Paenibacillus sp. GP183]SEB50665.1 N-acetylglutamate synthase, GNAT family [Paenibacillus sp. GP183]
MIREAIPQDRDVIQHLYEVLCPDEPINVLPERIAEINNDTNNFLYVYDVDGQVKATVFLSFFLDPMFGLQPYALVENIVVDDSVRGRGIGKKLLDHIDMVCREQNCTKIMLLSNSFRVDAHKFFEANGFNGTVSKGFKKYLQS